MHRIVTHALSEIPTIIVKYYKLTSSIALITSLVAPEATKEAIEKHLVSSVYYLFFCVDIFRNIPIN